MARRPKLEDGDLYAIAMYLAREDAGTEIHAELPKGHQEKFEQEYAEATNDFAIPAQSRHPYYIWPAGTNKQGRELRVYFMPGSPQPPIVDTLTDRGKRWPARAGQRRINHSNLVMQLFECGFVLGSDQNRDRIMEFMSKRFPAGKYP